MDTLNQILQQYTNYADNYAVRLLLAFMILLIAVLLAVAVQRIINGFLRQRAPTWGTFLINVLQTLLILGGLAAIVQVTGVVSAAVLLTILTLFTAGASLSASKLISDALATIRILSLGYYRVGDLVTVAGGTSGLVTNINAFCTVLKTRNRDKVIVNNSAVIGENVYVHTGYRGHELAVAVPIRLPHNRQQVIQWLLEVAADYPQRLIGTEFDPKVYHEFGATSENYTLILYVQDGFENRHHATAISLAIAEKLSANGLEIGVNIKGGPTEIKGSLRIGTLVEEPTIPILPSLGHNGEKIGHYAYDQSVVLLMPQTS